MKKLGLGVIFSIVAGYGANATILTVIDSGTDMKHQEIVNNVWVNPVDSTINNTDEDNNSYQDDVNGWNFAEKNNEVIDYKYLGRLTDDIRRFFDIQTKSLKGVATQSDVDWVQKKRGDKEFIKDLQIYGNFMHGTHVSGVAINEQLQDVELMAIKLLPTEVKGVLAKYKSLKGSKNIILKFILEKLADTQMKLLVEVGKYVNGHKSDIANGSFGIGISQAKMIVAQVAKLILRRDATEKEKEEYGKFFLEKVLIASSGMVDASPQTFFVFAAGNDASNNDVYPASPASIVRDNVISVAATLERESLASFSSFGAKSVHVAAPGVGIKSSVPGDQYLEVSGTSQAAPYVANIAAAMKNKNKNLSPKEIKNILMKTVDKKDFLIGKVVSGGIVNKERALAAADMSSHKSLKEAILMSFRSFPVKKTKSSLTLQPIIPSLNGMVNPLGNMFEIE